MASRSASGARVGGEALGVPPEELGPLIKSIWYYLPISFVLDALVLTALAITAASEEVFPVSAGVVALVYFGMGYFALLVQYGVWTIRLVSFREPYISHFSSIYFLLFMQLREMLLMALLFVGYLGIKNNAWDGLDDLSDGEAFTSLCGISPMVVAGVGFTGIVPRDSGLTLLAGIVLAFSKIFWYTVPGFIIGIIIQRLRKRIK